MFFIDPGALCHIDITVFQATVSARLCFKMTIGGRLKQSEQEKRAAAGKGNALSVQVAAEKLDAALDQNDTVLFMEALSEVIKARGGFTATARKAGLNRTALYKVTSKHGNPGLSTLVGLLSVVGLRLSVVPLAGSIGLATSTPKPAARGRELGELGNVPEF